MSLEQLRARRRKWVEANRENGFEEGINNLLTQLYPDNAHFIYELLQNAEDTNATVVRFKLTGSAIEFEHDGLLLFSLKDVESITSIGTSTKRDDPTNIGKFGVGFKAVFAYTNTPQIHSGDFHFRIHDLVVPETDRVPRPKLGERETRFVFPFDNRKKPRKQAVEEIERGLRDLSDNTLLFLSHIRKIEYSLPDGSSGILERVEHDDGHIEIRTSQPGRRKHVSHWLHFQKEVKVKDEDGKSRTCRIAIAYCLEGEEGKKGRAWKIIPLDHGQVSIYFPAEKETSNLRFHIHAPFASTVARDSVRDCAANRVLRDQLAGLVVESLSAIREQGWLTVDFLGVLPNPYDYLTQFYEPIREAIVRAFREEALTPMKLAFHAAASSVFRGPSKISDVITDKDLEFLLDDDKHETPLWAANPPQKNQREDKFLESLTIEEWGWSELANILYHTYHVEQRERIEEWISNKSDAWLLRFYALLGEACDDHEECVDVRELCIVRVTGEGGRHVLPGEAYFPPENDTSSLPTDVHFVRPEVYKATGSGRKSNYAKSFLETAGVRPYDDRAGIERVLREYPPRRPIPLKKHINHLRQFIRYWKQKPSETDLFKDVLFLADSVNEEGRIEDTYSPQHLCLDAPYEETGLTDLYNIHAKTAVWPGYMDEIDAKELKDFVDFLKAIGLMYRLVVKKQSTWDRGEWTEQLHKDYQEGTRERNPTDEDYAIPKLDDYAWAGSIPASRLVWRALIEADKKAAHARYAPNSQYAPRTDDSLLVIELKKGAWIPDINGKFRVPEDMTKDDLRPDFPYDDRNGLLTAIGFGENAKKRSEEYQEQNRNAQRMGFRSLEEGEEVAKLIHEEGLTLEDIRSASKKKHTEQPKQAVPDPERRRKNVLANIADAPSRESIQRERAIQKGIPEITAQAKAYLRAKYKNEEGQLVCQCCHMGMPFKLSSGEHYFEAVQCTGDKEVRHFQNRLALCPTCAAMYQYARATDDSEIQRRIVEHAAEDQAASVEIAVNLAGRERTLHFVGTHWFDLKTLLGKG